MKLGMGLMGAGLLGVSLSLACSGDEPASSEVAGTDSATLVAALSANSDGSADTWLDAAGGEPVRVMGCGFGHIVSKIVERFDADQSGELDAEERASLVEQRPWRVRGDAGPGRGGPGHRGHGRAALLLSLYDADGSGALEAAELEQLKADIEARCEARQANLIAEFDSDGDGTLSEAEWETAHAALHERFARHHAMRVRELDADGDGELDAGEALEAYEAADAERSDAAQSFDVDGDGTLNATEHEALRAHGRDCVREGRPVMSKPGGRRAPVESNPPATEEEEMEEAVDAE